MNSMSAHSLSALADPTRQRIVEMLAGGALSSGQIASRFELSAPAVSQHLKTLRGARLVSVRADKQRRIYELNPEGVKELADWIARIRAFWNPKLDALEEALKRDQT
jgi:DNA-binding transcriptional ArsR family regulator